MSHRETKREDSDSTPQRAAEAAAIRQIAREIGVSRLVGNHKFEIGNGWASVDGFHESNARVVIVEVNAHIGGMKTATRNKVLRDAFKMLVISNLNHRRWARKRVRRVLVFLSKKARDSFGPKSWGQAAFDQIGIEARLCRLSRKLTMALQKAQSRQDLRFNAKNA
jgi:hypothetical protein